MKKMCEILDGVIENYIFKSSAEPFSMVLTAFLTSIQCEVVHNHLFLVIVKVAIKSEMAMNARHLTGAGTMFLDAFDACLCDFVGGTTWNLQHVRLLSTWIGIPGDQVKSFVFFQLNPAVLSPETSLGPVFFVLLWHVRLCKDILSFICILLFVGPQGHLCVFLLAQLFPTGIRTEHLSHVWLGLRDWLPHVHAAHCSRNCSIPLLGRGGLV